MLELRATNNDVVAPYAERFPNAKFYANKRPWEQKVDVAMPCATQNELNEADAKQLVENGVICVSEGANMPCTPEAVHILQNNKVLYGPGKAANAGGVATSGLEMSQNSLRLSWSREEVDEKLHNIMIRIHEQCVEYGTEGDTVDYVKGANIAGFVKVADAMIEQGAV
jgi:glutamate dehydrogenase (NADP+)